MDENRANVESLIRDVAINCPPTLEMVESPIVAGDQFQKEVDKQVSPMLIEIDGRIEGIYAELTAMSLNFTSQIIEMENERNAAEIQLRKEISGDIDREVQVINLNMTEIRLSLQELEASVEMYRIRTEKLENALAKSDDIILELTSNIDDITVSLEKSKNRTIDIEIKLSNLTTRVDSCPAC